MDGGTLSGKMIRILAPVVPFIYLEIVLEALLKGMGKQNFSSLNYLAEYVIRICVVLIFIPLFGFYAVVFSFAVAALPELFCPALREHAVGMVLFLGIALPLYVMVFWLLRERHTWVTCREW